MSLTENNKKIPRLLISALRQRRRSFDTIDHSKGTCNCDCKCRYYTDYGRLTPRPGACYHYAMCPLSGSACRIISNTHMLNRPDRIIEF